MDDLVQYDQSTVSALEVRPAAPESGSAAQRAIQERPFAGFNPGDGSANAQLSEIELAGLYSQVVDVVVESLRKDIDMPLSVKRWASCCLKPPRRARKSFPPAWSKKSSARRAWTWRIGIASVPGDAVTTEALLEQAELP
jgi:hypothetical protein